MPIKVVLADENEILRKGLAKLLEEQEEIEVVSLCSNGGEVIDEVKKAQPHVVLIGGNILRNASDSVIDKLCELSQKVNFAVFTGVAASSQSQKHIYTATKAGAHGYLSKEMKIYDLVKCIDSINQGQLVVSPQLTNKLTSKLRTLEVDENKGETALSAREEEVLKLLATGCTNKEIADKLFITMNTARVHIKNILGKLQLRNRQQAVAYAVQHGLAKAIYDET